MSSYNMPGLINCSVPSNTVSSINAIPTLGAMTTVSQLYNNTSSTICTQDYVDSKMFSFGYTGIFTWIDTIIKKISSTFKILSENIELCFSKQFEQYVLAVKLFNDEICKIDLNILYSGNQFPNDQLTEIINEIESKSFVWKVNMLNM